MCIGKIVLSLKLEALVWCAWLTVRNVIFVVVKLLQKKQKQLLRASTDEESITKSNRC